jgi:hypothetical protein
MLKLVLGTKELEKVELLNSPYIFKNYALEKAKASIP